MRTHSSSGRRGPVRRRPLHFTVLLSSIFTVALGWSDPAAVWASPSSRLEETSTAETSRDAAATAAARKSAGLELELGGDDVVVDPTLVGERPILQVAGDGTLYLATSGPSVPGSPGPEIYVYRSQDGGQSWERWISYARDIDAILCDFKVVEGDQDRAYTLFSFGPSAVDGLYSPQIWWRDLQDGGTQGAAEIVLPSGVSAGVSAVDMSLAHDATEYSDYYLYAAVSANEDIYFSRSTDFGSSWATPYRVANASPPSFRYAIPRLTYAGGGRLALAYVLVNEDAVLGTRWGTYVRTGDNFGAGSLDWGSPSTLYSLSSLRALPSSLTHVLGTTTLVLRLWGTALGVPSATGVRHSVDSGGTWPESQFGSLPEDASLVAPIAADPATGELATPIVVSSETGPTQVGVVRSNVSDPSTWGTLERFSESPGAALGASTVAMDPSRGMQLAVAWSLDGTGELPGLVFDAEWARDPGIPNLQPGFPVDLPVGAIGNTPPAVVDLDGDDDLEIVFASTDGQVMVYEHDGSMAAGWPVDLEVPLPIDGPVAIGDLNGDGVPAIVVGTAQGVVHAFDPLGVPMMGWPVDLGTAAPTFVSIGALGGPYPRNVVALSGDRRVVLNWRGADLSPAWGTAVGTYLRPAAVGDVDGDGVAEIVSAQTGGVQLHRLDSDSQVGFRPFPGEVLADAPTLGDVDEDGDLEIAVATQGGRLYLMQHDFSDYSPDWPWVEPLGNRLTGALLVDMIGSSPLEVVFATGPGQIHQYTLDGGGPSLYPQDLGSVVYMPPIADTVDRSSSNVIIGSTLGDAWSWQNTGAVPTGWPRTLGGSVEETPATGDLDDDGNNEVVILSTDRLWVFDVGYPPQSVPRRRWPMYQHDPQRTGCQSCPEDVVTGVGDSAVGSQVLFAAPSPNPMSELGFFRFVLPAPSRISLKVYDVRGRLLRTATEAELDIGPHEVRWDGRAENGRRVAAGIYLARLSVLDGPAAGEWTRKVTVVR